MITQSYEWRNNGADERDRTADLLITNQLLYQLSYVGVWLTFFSLPNHRAVEELEGLIMQSVSATVKKSCAETRSKVAQKA
jgi:hypothetical protein